MLPNNSRATEERETTNTENPENINTEHKAEENSRDPAKLPRRELMTFHSHARKNKNKCVRHSRKCRISKLKNWVFLGGGGGQESVGKRLITD